MKQILSAVVLIVTVLGLGLMAPPASAWAGDVAAGKAIFGANCAACHMGGGNVVNGAKTLKKEALEQYEMASLDKIITQVTKGKNAMPAFLGKLNDTDIENVASYVLSQAEAGW